MNAQRAIEKVLQDVTKELLKVFSEAVLQAVSQVGAAGRAALPAVSAATLAAVATKRGPRGRKVARKVEKAAKPAKATRARRGGAVLKSTPAQVSRLSDRVVDLLRKSTRNLASKEIMKALGLSPTEEGRFQYALNKLKEANVVQQHGDRRQARYGIGSASKGKAKSGRGPGRPRKNPAPAPEADVVIEATPEEPSAPEAPVEA